jgi:hypothetical protein
MSLKDEIDKLIAAERETLEKQAVEFRTYREKQKAHFLPLRAVLEEMIKAIDPAYLRVRLEDEEATIEVVNPKMNRLNSELFWSIGSGWVDDLPDEEELLEEHRVFSLVEMSRHELYLDVEPLSKVFKFQTTAEVIQHLLKQIAKQIARYQQIEESSCKLNSKDRL